MRKLFFLLVLIVSVNMTSQTEKENTPEQLVKDMFAAFHKQDTLALQKFSAPDTPLLSVSKMPNGETSVKKETFAGLVKSIGSIPAEASFEERISEYRVEENGLLATVTTPYSFYFNGSLSHCGVNSFTLVKFGEEWKIVHLIDTRLKQDCN